MTEDIDSLLKEAEELGILNIDVNGQLTPEVIRVAINAVKRHKARQDKDEIKRKIKKEGNMTYPPKADPLTATWVIAFDVKLERLYEYSRDPQNAEILGDKKPDVYVRDIRAVIFNEIYRVLGGYGFNKRLQNSLVFNNQQDATVAFKAVSLGLAHSWAKYFVERIHLFQVEPNSDAIELLNKGQVIAGDDRPDWFTNDMFDFIMKASNEEDIFLLD